MNTRLNGADDFLESDGSARRSIQLRGVVRFADRELVALDAGQLSGEAKKFLHAHREICAVEQAAPTPLRDSPEFRQMGVPASGANYNPAAKCKDRSDVFNRGTRGSEIDDYVY